MAEGNTRNGCIFHWEDYQFADGDTANKFLVILGCKDGSNYLAVIATSQPHRRRFDPGCDADRGYYHIPGGGRDWFRKDTWLLLSEPREISPAEFLAFGMKGELRHAGDLRDDIANAIRNCLRRCEDVSEHHLSLL